MTLLTPQPDLNVSHETEKRDASLLTCGEVVLDIDRLKTHAIIHAHSIGIIILNDYRRVAPKSGRRLMTIYYASNTSDLRNKVPYPLWLIYDDTDGR